MERSPEIFSTSPVRCIFSPKLFRLTAIAEILDPVVGAFMKHGWWWLRVAGIASAALCFGFALQGTPARAQGQDRAPEYFPADIQYGQQIFATQCTPCHGVSGDQIPGVNFRAGVFKRVVTDNDLRATISTGVPGTEMRPFAFGPAELTEIVAYLRNMNSYNASGSVVGDVSRGQALFAGAGKCSSCHAINGKGPRVAPDLGDIGTLRTADLLHKTLIDPAGAMLPFNRAIHAVTKDGKVINGRRLNEDTYTVQLVDENERLVSLTKADLREYSVLKTTNMPSYKDKFNAQEFADLEAYLLSLKGVK